MRLAIGALTAAVLLLLGACTGSRPAPSPIPLVTVLPDDPSRPYVVTAIDYHFHDAHPTRPITPGRTLIVENQGRVRHNVTIPSIGFSENVPPGGRVVIPDAATRLGRPGRYPFFCKFHIPQRMRGVIVVSASGTSSSSSPGA